MLTRPLRQDELEAATQVCVRAFHDYPALSALFPGPAWRRAPVSRRFYRPTIADALRHGRVDAMEDEGKVRGVAVWLPPVAYPLTPSRLFGFAPLVGSVLARYPTRAIRGIQALASLERHHPADPPHWYLAVVAVDPSHQGRGIGRRLLEPVLARADEEGHRCFLETATRANVAWYARLGFDTLTEQPCFPDGPPQWFMQREPLPTPWGAPARKPPRGTTGSR